MTVLLLTFLLTIPSPTSVNTARTQIATQSNKVHGDIAASLGRGSSPAPPAWLPFVISALALGISGTGFYFQWIHTRGARVTLLNDGDTQNAAVRRWDELPRNVQNEFPQYDQTNPGYSLVRLVVLNTGDRPGFLKIESSTAKVPWQSSSDAERLRVSYSTYVVIPALAVTDKLILLRNVPEVATTTEITVYLHVLAGGPAGRFRPHSRKQQYACQLAVRLIPNKSIGILGHSDATK